MSEYFIGIDSGTQSTKTILLDTASGAVVASASESYELIEGLPAGHKEQRPAEWIAAVRAGVKAALERSGVARASVRGVGVSGQQHGFVALDENDQVIRASKLWNDTSTGVESEEIIASIGGLEKTIEAVGNGVPPGFTASKILWLKKHEPENYS
ncbi:MAG: xylulokinase, partial [Chloracidobacterium sp.]|nr:xylulokinase [Chloracidobacterium sp.]